VATSPGSLPITFRRKNPLIPEAQASESFSADRRIAFSQFRPGIEKATTNPENPASPVAPADGTGVNPACPVALADGTWVRNISLAEKTIKDVLKYFGETFKIARRRYRQFVKKGIDQGKRPDFQGGGLVRSAGGERIGLLGLKKEERELSDERILGSGHFVAQVLEKVNEVNQKRMNKCSLQVLCQKIISAFGIKEEDLRSSIKKRGVIEAKASFGYLAIKAMGYSGREVGQFLNMRSYSAIRIPARFALNAMNCLK